MKTISPDTSPEVARILIEGYRKMPVWMKLNQARELPQLVRIAVAHKLAQTLERLGVVTG
jgi:hypothetical protein